MLRYIGSIVALTTICVISLWQTTTFYISVTTLLWSQYQCLYCGKQEIMFPAKTRPVVSLIWTNYMAIWIPRLFSCKSLTTSLLDCKCCLCCNIVVILLCWNILHPALYYYLYWKCYVVIILFSMRNLHLVVQNRVYY